MRQIINFNKNWLFIEKELSFEKAFYEKGKHINLPHTWNNLDGQDGGADYKRASYFYRKEFNKPNVDLANNDVYLEFKGVSQIATIYLNNKQIGYHEGGFSTFRVKLNDYLEEKNILVVNANNTPNKKTYPQFADFTFFGGIYRDVNLIIVPRCHFDLDYYGGPGLAITPIIKNKKANVKVVGYVSNPIEGLDIVCKVLDEEQKVVCEAKSSIDKPEFDFVIDNPILWDGVNCPYLYKTIIQIVKEDEVIDEISSDFGIREFKVDPETGFYLNGRSYPLRGVCRHQDRLNKGWAITNKEHEEDISLIKEVGANTIRLAHYQQDGYMYDLCDKEGLCIWVEIPFISQFMETAKDNTISQMKELVIQNYNHPSIICWGLSNEITMNDENDPLLYENHVELNNLVHELDKTRLTTMAQVSMLSIENKLNELTDLRSYNIYYGWYGGEFDDNGKFLDEFHSKWPNLSLGIAEYGAEANLKLHTSKPEQGDYSEEYQALYHEHMIKTINDRPYLWATHVWNMFDFAADARDEGGTKGRNNKGLVTYDRKIRKDSFYLYKSYWNDSPMLHITSKRYLKRENKEQTIKVYSNNKSVSLFVNGKFIVTQEADHVFNFKVTLRNGINFIKVGSEGLTDHSIIIITKKEPKEYSLSGNPNAVKNWFEEEYTFNYPEGYFSINDKIGEIMENPQGKALFEEMFKKMGDNPTAKAAGMKDPAKLMNMVKNFTLKRIAGMAKGAFSAKDLYELNEVLNKIKKD